MDVRLLYNHIYSCVGRLTESTHILGCKLLVYICATGSAWSREGEILLLQKENEYWTAYDAAIVGDSLHCRQRVFRSASNIVDEGWHE